MNSWWWSQKQHNVVAAGRRSTKSWRAKRKLVFGTPYWGGALSKKGNYAYCCPTRLQAKSIAWDDLKAMTGPFWSKEPSETELTIFLLNGSELSVVGMDRPQRIEGAPLHGAVIDEIDDHKPNIWEETMQPMTADTGAWVDFIGVPNGRKILYKLSKYEQELVDWGFFTWRSSEVIDAETLKRIKDSVDERTFEQEYEASFLEAALRAYYAFSDKNISSAYEYDARLDSFLCWDFNAGEKPMSCCLLQKFGHENYAVVKDWSLVKSNTQTMCDVVDTWLTEHKFEGNLTITGDSSGKRRTSNSSFSDYAIIEAKFKNRKGYEVKMRPTLSIKDRVASTNSLLLNTSGKVRLHVRPECKVTIRDFQEVGYMKDGIQLDQDTDKLLTHMSDAISYFAYNFHDIASVETEVNVR